MTSVKVTIPNRSENIVNIKLLIYDNDKFYFNSLGLHCVLFEGFERTDVDAITGTLTENHKLH